MSEKGILPADLYDAFELSALAHRGIGGDRWVDDNYAPFCIGGHMEFVYAGFYPDHAHNQLDLALSGDFVSENNRAVRAINQRKGRKNLNARVSWEEYVKETRLVRGD